MLSEYINKELIRLSLSENSFGCSPNVINAVIEELSKINRYPNSGAYELVNVIASKFNVDKNQIFVGNGIDELLLLIAIAFNADNAYAVANESTFPGHQAAFDVVKMKYELLPLKNYSVSVLDMIDNLSEDTKIIYLCNPHNPTGTVISNQDMDKLIDYADKNDITVIVDEAYIEFVNSKENLSALKYVEDGKNVIVLRTLSKIYGLAGIRCGYVLSNQNIIERISSARKVLPYNVNRIAIKAAIEALCDQAYIKEVKESILTTKHWLYKELNRLNLEFVESETNFILIRLPIDSNTAFLKLRDQFGILIRDADQYGFPRHIRVGIGRKIEMEYFIDAIREILNE